MRRLITPTLVFGVCCTSVLCGTKASAQSYYYSWGDRPDKTEQIESTIKSQLKQQRNIEWSPPSWKPLPMPQFLAPENAQTGSSGFFSASNMDPIESLTRVLFTGNQDYQIDMASFELLKSKMPRDLSVVSGTANRKSVLAQILEKCGLSVVESDNGRCIQRPTVGSSVEESVETTSLRLSLATEAIKRRAPLHGYGTPVSMFLQSMSGMSGIPVSVDFAELDMTGWEPVTLRFERDATISDSLERGLRSVGLGFTVDPTGITISKLQ